MLIIEIVLTIIAWTRGWKWKALIPVIAAFGIGLIYGLSGAANNGVSPGLIVVDVLAIVALAIMCFVKPKSKTSEPTEPTKNSEPTEPNLK